MAREDLDATRRFEIVVYQQPPPLVLDTDSNSILTNYPGVYLYGTLTQAAPYYGRQEDIVTWRQLYEAEIERANGEAADTPGDVMLERIA